MKRGHCAFTRLVPLILFQLWALFAILRCFGLHDLFVNIAIRLHEVAIINVKICEGGFEVKSPITFGRVLDWTRSFSSFVCVCNKDLISAPAQTLLPRMGVRFVSKVPRINVRLWASLFPKYCAIFSTAAKLSSKGPRTLFSNCVASVQY
jgi:hypothetical protein